MMFVVRIWKNVMIQARLLVSFFECMRVMYVYSIYVFVLFTQKCINCSVLVKQFELAKGIWGRELSI